MHGDSLAYVIPVVFITIAAVAIFAVRRQSARVSEVLNRVATSSSWMNVRSLRLFNGVRGTWRQFPVHLSYQPRNKGAPQRMIVKIGATTDVRLIVKRKFEGLFSNRPLAWFGPPLVEVHQPAAAQMWVRGDAPLAERIFSDQKVAALLSNNLVARFDEVKVDPKGLRIIRALDERPVKRKYDMPTFSMSFNAEKFEPIAREEIQLAEALVEKLSVIR